MVGPWIGEILTEHPFQGRLAQLAKQRKVRVIHGTAKFESPTSLVLDNGETVAFEKCIIAAGSEAVMLPGLPDDQRIVDSTGALDTRALSAP